MDALYIAMIVVGGLIIIGGFFLSIKYYKRMLTMNNSELSPLFQKRAVDLTLEEIQQIQRYRMKESMKTAFIIFLGFFFGTLLIVGGVLLLVLK